MFYVFGKLDSAIKMRFAYWLTIVTVCAAVCGTLPILQLNMYALYGWLAFGGFGRGLPDCQLVSFVTRYVIWVGRMSSPLGANVYHCVARCKQDIDSILHLTPAAIGQCFGDPYPLVMWVES